MTARGIDKTVTVRIYQSDKRRLADLLIGMRLSRPSVIFPDAIRDLLDRAGIAGVDMARPRKAARS